jgi:hypothetical protein
MTAAENRAADFLSLEVLQPRRDEPSMALHREPSTLHRAPAATSTPPANRTDPTQDWDRSTRRSRNRAGAYSPSGQHSLCVPIVQVARAPSASLLRLSS